MKKSFLFSVFVILSGCVGLVPGSEAYKPYGQLEIENFKKADFTIYPNDVRANAAKLDQYKGKTVVWTGIITNVELVEPVDEPKKSYWRITAQHHYFDWILDHNMYNIAFYMSPQGEGEFMLVFGGDRYAGPDRDKHIARGKKMFEPGNMIWAYGTPDKILKNGVVRVTGFAQSAEKKFYDAKKLEYGRTQPMSASFKSL